MSQNNFNFTKIGVTVARNYRGSELISRAKNLARDFSKFYGENSAAVFAVFIERAQNLTLEDLRRENNLDALIILGTKGARIHCAAGEFAYHAGMAVLRIKELKRGGHDNFVQALNLRAGMRVLDCTLGLAADAAIASYIVGKAGKVVGVEASPLVHYAVREGLENYSTGDADLDAALRRINIFYAEAEAFLEELAAQKKILLVNNPAQEKFSPCAEKYFGAENFVQDFSADSGENFYQDLYDVVYFDPMFRRPVQGSVSMDALRPLACEKMLTQKAVDLALKIAPRVVIKERSEKILRAYGCTEFAGGKYSSVKYGIITRK